MRRAIRSDRFAPKLTRDLPEKCAAMSSGSKAQVRRQVVAHRLRDDGSLVALFHPEHEERAEQLARQALSVDDVFRALIGVLPGAHEDVPSRSVQEQALGKDARERTTGRSCGFGRAHAFDEVRVLLHVEEHLRPRIGRAVVGPHVGVGPCKRRGPRDHHSLYARRQEERAETAIVDVLSFCGLALITLSLREKVFQAPRRQLKCVHNHEGREDEAALDSSRGLTPAN
jgi:hypothetical protein